jgi:flagellar protein FliS
MENVSNEYLRNAVLTASQEQLHLMLYDGAIRFTKLGVRGIENENWEDAFNGFSRAQKIILEMLNSLNYDVDRQLCERMAGLYNFMYGKLVEASIHRDVKIAAEALKLLEYQRETWVMLMEKLAEERGTNSQPQPQPLVAEQPDENYRPLSVEG